MFHDNTVKISEKIEQVEFIEILPQKNQLIQSLHHLLPFCFTVGKGKTVLDFF